MKYAVLLAFGFGFAAATGAMAQTPSPPAAAAAAQAATAEGVDYMVGQWLGSAVDPQTGETLTIDYKVQRLPSGAWLAGSGVSTDQTLKSNDMWGRDPLTKEIMRVV